MWVVFAVVCDILPLVSKAASESAVGDDSGGCRGGCEVDSGGNVVAAGDDRFGYGLIMRLALHVLSPWWLPADR